MKGRVILIDRLEGRGSAAALLVDGRLEDLLIDPPPGDTAPNPGEIFWARVDRVIPRGGAFVKLSPERTGWLREPKGVRPGQGVLVQVLACAEPGKASPVTRRLLYKGRQIIHTPDAPGINVSRLIRDEAERTRLTGIVQAAVTDWHAPVEGGFIVRTAAEGAESRELAREVQSVLEQHAIGLGKTCKHAPGGQRISAPVVVGFLALRDWTDPLPTRVIADPGTARALKNDETDGLATTLEQSCAALRDRLEAAGSPFTDLGIWEEIDGLKSPRVEVAAEAFMFIEPTRAFVAVDINTGGDFSPAAGLKANIAALRELPRQLRLRGLGGQIVIDPAPMPKQERRQLETTLKAALKRDPVETNVVGWTPMGLIELQRKRERRPLTELLPEDMP